MGELRSCVVVLHFDDEPFEHLPHKKLHAFTPFEFDAYVTLAQLQAGPSERSHASPQRVGLALALQQCTFCNHGVNEI